MQIQINAAARLVTAATSADAGRIVLWIQKAIPGVKMKKKGKAGTREVVEFTAKAGKHAVELSVSLDHDYDPPRIELEGGCDGEEWHAEERTGALTVRSFKDQLRDTLEMLKGAGNAEEYNDVRSVLKKLISVKSKIE